MFLAQTHLLLAEAFHFPNGASLFGARLRKRILLSIIQLPASHPRLLLLLLRMKWLVKQITENEIIIIAFVVNDSDFIAQR